VTSLNTVVGLIDNAQPLAGAAGAAVVKLSKARRPKVSEKRHHDAGGDELNRQLALYPRTDLGNAERFRERNRGKLLWCSAVGWFWWDGRRWSREGADEHVRIAAHETVRGLQDEADAIAGTAIDSKVSTRGKGKDEEPIMLSDQLRAWGRQSEQNSKINQLAEQSQAYLAVAPDGLDADRFAINVRNGTLRVRKDEAGEGDSIAFSQHNPDDRITKLIPVDYVPEASCPQYDAFLQDVQPEESMQRFLHQWIGISLTGDISQQRLCVFWGTGKNGKSVFIETAALIAGDYSDTVPIETFLADGRGRSAGQATPDLAILPGVRLLRTSEPKRGAQFDEGLIKMVTGGEPIMARNLNLPYFRFYPSFKLTISGNHRPRIGGTDEGIWRRMTLVPWRVTIPEEKRDPNLVDKLRAEASGILNRYLDGLRDFLDRGLMLPEEVTAATTEYRRDHDTLGRWLEECTEAKEGVRTSHQAALALFNAWAGANGLTSWKGKGFTNAMTERGIQKTKSGNIYFVDLQLIKTCTDFDGQFTAELNTRED
jgi:putative DNA primase/helicase